MLPKQLKSPFEAERVKRNYRVAIEFKKLCAFAVLSRNIVTFREDLGRSAPVPGRSNILSPECAGLITNLPPAARCCSRGRLHSVSVAAWPRYAFVVDSMGRNERHRPT